MNKKIIHYSIIAFIWLAVLYPVFERARYLHWAFDTSLLPNLFPIFGLIAASLLWLHSISGVFEPWLRKHINFDRFIHITASIILWCMILHPLLLLISLNFNFNELFLGYTLLYLRIGIVAWLLLIIYDITKPLKKYQFFAKNWNNILIISNIGFLLTFIHALYLGSDLQFEPLRAIWIFYGITATLGIIYTYAILPLLKKS